MSKEKQIEEMAEDLETAKVNALATIGSMNDGFGAWYAKALYNAGWRMVILCKNCKFCEHRYPIKEIGEEAKESWYCYARNHRVEPEEYCSFANMGGGEE